MSQSDRRIPPNRRITKLRMLLMERDEPQYMIAAKLGVSPGRLSEYALGNRPIPQRRIIDFCRLLRCNAEDLFGYADVEVTNDS